MLDLTTPQGVVALMSSSQNEHEWNKNCNAVKAANSGYPNFWYEKIILSGIAARTLGAEKATIKISPL